VITDQTRSGRTYHHNGDFSGEVWVNMSPNEVDAGTSFDGKEYVTVNIPTADLVDIVGEYVRRQRISAAEQLPTWALVGLMEKPHEEGSTDV
jgi:hypothetical protein